ncbi:MAG: kinase inhibitor [Archangiaceae bacterium]|nr:kinase inhibitor [Archangiaceae bacterium]
MRSLFVIAALFAVPAFAAGKFSLTSTEVKPNSTLTEKQVFNSFGCTGENLSPHLAWADAPKDTKSFVVTVYDPDAPTGSGWWHWVVYNIPADAKELAAGAGSGKAELPAGAVQGHTDFGATGFGGACPPEGDKPHRYIFTVYALKVEKLEVPETATAAMVGYMTNANKLGSATFTAKYGRPKAKAEKAAK